MATKSKFLSMNIKKMIDLVVNAAMHSNTKSDNSRIHQRKLNCIQS